MMLLQFFFFFFFFRSVSYVVGIVEAIRLSTNQYALLKDTGII